MPACKECEYLDGTECRAYQEATRILARPLPEPPLGSCMLPIVRGYMDKIGAGMKVLEIGCGTWEGIKDRCDEVGAHYEGIEVNEYYFAT